LKLISSAGHSQAVVNEKTDDAATHQQLMEEMAAQADKADALGRSLIAKQSALGVLEHKLEVLALLIVSISVIQLCLLAWT
jgi:hypothetical protein